MRRSSNSDLAKVLSLGFLFGLLFLFCKCEKSNQIPIKCTPMDSRIEGDWKLSQECLYYVMGGDSTWKQVSINLIYSFTDHCTVKSIGDNNTSCNEGKFNILKDHVAFNWSCPDGSSSPDTLLYRFLAAGDTLMLTKYLDDAVFSYKYVKLIGR